MKKIILSLLAVMIVTGGAFAQKSNVRKARNQINMDEPDFKAAREYILPALSDSTTNKEAYTWYIAGLIGYKQNDLLLKTAMLGKKVDADVKGQAIMESYKYFLKAYKLDSMPDRRGRIRPRYQKDIRQDIKSYFTNQQNLVAYGASLFGKKEYLKTINVFETYLGIPKLPMMANEHLKLDSTYTMIKYYTAIACTNAGLSQKAIKYYESLLNANYEELTVHELLCEEYKKTKDTVDYVRILKAGFEKFPKEGWFLQNLINYYIYSKQTKEALVYLDNAIQRDSTSAEYRDVKGNLDEALGNLEAAKADFKKAIELNPKLADAYAGYGRLIFNEAVKMSDDANNIKDNAKYNKAKKAADAVFAKSLPYFQKASELAPNEDRYKHTLKNLYYRLKMNKEYEAISKELGE